MATAEEVLAEVLTCLDQAVTAIADQDIESVVTSLERAVLVYEEHPTVAQGDGNNLRVLLVCIRVTVSLCEKLGLLPDDVVNLERRAERLRSEGLH
jgi:hypothetical protein